MTSFIKRNYTVNHALVEEELGELVICAHDHLEVCALDGTLLRRTSHPWFAGGHTVHRNGLDAYVVSCSASDAVLTIDRSSLDVIDEWRLPANLYGTNYQLTTDDDVRRHFIETDLQIAHVNSAYPYADGLLLTCFIQGAIVSVDRNGLCKEVVTGYVGCHGGRTTEDGHLYFADSPRGDIVWIGDDLTVSAKMSCDSAWLHDVVWLFADYYACAIGDRNELAIVEATSGRVMHVQALSPFGSTPCLLSSGHY